MILKKATGNSVTQQFYKDKIFMLYRANAGVRHTPVCRNKKRRKAT